MSSSPVTLPLCAGSTVFVDLGLDRDGNIDENVPDSDRFVDDWYYGVLDKHLDSLNCVMNVLTNGTGNMTIHTFDWEHFQLHDMPEPASSQQQPSSTTTPKRTTTIISKPHQ